LPFPFFAVLTPPLEGKRTEFNTNCEGTATKQAEKHKRSGLTKTVDCPKPAECETHILLASFNCSRFLRSFVCTVAS